MRDSARAFVAIPFVGALDDGRVVDPSDLLPVAASDTRLGNDIERWKMLAGRRADPDRVDEAVASFELADRLGLHVGSTIDFRFYAADTFTATAGRLVGEWPERLARRHTTANQSAGADGPRQRVRVVGIEASPAEFPPLNTDLAPILHLTPAFAHAYQSTVVGSDLAYLRLAPGHDLAELQLAVEEMAAGQPVSFVSTRDNQTAKVQRAIDVEANVLLVVAGLVALAALIAIAQAFARQSSAERGDRATLRSLGMDDRQVTMIALVRTLDDRGRGDPDRGRLLRLRRALRTAPPGAEGRTARRTPSRRAGARNRRDPRARDRGGRRALVLSCRARSDP